MLLLLGKPEAIRKYIKEMLPDIDEYSDVVYYPGKEHYTEFKILIEDLKSDNPLWSQHKIKSLLNIY